MSKVKGFLVVLIIFIITMFFQNSIFAAVTHELGIVQLREDGYSYKIKVGGTGSERLLDIFKIVEYINDSKSFENNIYCIKGGPGFGGTITDPLQRRTYDISYDLKNVGDIPDNYKNVLPSDTDITKEIEVDGETKEVTYSNYNAVLWLVDNIYLPKYEDETARQEMRDNLLKAVFKDKLEDDELYPPFDISQVNLTDSDIEVVQQLAIWHFTNAGDNEYDVGETLPAIQISEKDSTTNYDGYDMDSYRQEDAQALYSYLINQAMLNASSYGKGDDRHLTKPVQLANNTLTTQYIDNNFVVGPFRIDKLSDLPYSLEANVVNENDENISDYTLYIKDSNGDLITAEEGKKITDIIGQDFFIAVGQDSGITEIKLKLKVSYYESEAVFWTVSSSPNSEQPVVIIEKKPQEVEQVAGINYNFDLALRKFITGVNDNQVTDRVPQVTIDSKTGKITYNHKKTPIEVESGDIVTYTLRIYNEGKVAGYANEIKDDIPEGLEFLPDNETNIEYGWRLSEDGKSIVTNYLQKDDNKTNLLKPFDSETMDTPDYRDVKVAFKVIEPNSSDRTLINTAEINDDSDENGNPIEDIDSTPGNGVDGEDDIDKEYLVLKPFDLALRKFITGVNDKEITNRVPQVTVDSTGKITYTHTKTPVSVQNGDIVIYTIRVYNEGPTSGYANEIKDDIPAGTKFLIDNEINVEYRWKLSEDESYVTTDYLSYERDENNIIEAFDKDTMNTPAYKDVKIALQIIEPNTSTNILKNTAEISEDADKNGNPVEDIDSTPGNGVDGEDDIDYEYVKLKYFDLALRKFITAVNDEQVTDRVPQVVIDDEGNITYEHKKDPVAVSNGDLVEYTLRVYNEGSISGFASEVTDDVPVGLEFVEDNETNIQYRWKLSEDGTKITTDYLARENGSNNLIPAFDNTTMEEPAYRDLKIVFRVIEPNTSENILVNTAEISDDTDENGNPTEDIDSTPGNGVDGEDDIDKEYVKLVSFDLALRKFITAVNDQEITNRVPQITIDDEGNITYNHTKEPVVVANSDIVVYTIRVYNEGSADGYAEIIRDDVPQGLEFLPDNEINKQYGWVLSEDGMTITTDYLSEDRAVDNIIPGFDRDTMEEPAYKDVKVAFRVTEKMLPSDRILINTAEINDDSNEYDTPDVDSTPGNGIEGEDDIDKEYVRVQYFDLSLLKWVSKVFITENGVTTEQDTGHTGLEQPEPVVKVDLDRKNLNNITVKFEYTIKITNEGQIAGYAKEISDYIPEGLEFMQEDNPNWTVSGDKIVTRQLENTLLQPGETAEVKVILTWKNDPDNMGVKINIAEISEDYNDKGAHDIDSTPNNQVDGEDDIDDAPVALSIKTGQNRIYFTLIGIVLITIAGGVVLIKRYVL